MDLRMKPRVKKNAALAIFLAISFWHTPIYSDTLEETLCGKLYEESLKRAKNALLEGKREEAVRFLLDAEAIIKRCSSFPEQPQLENQEKGPAQAFYSPGEISPGVLLKKSIDLFGINGLA